MWEADYQRDFAAQKSSGPIIFTEEHRKKNLELKALVKDLLPIDDALKTSDCDLLYRFLIGRHWDVKSAEQMVRQYIALRQEHRLNNIMAEEVAEEVRVVISPIFGVDKEGLPILWMAPDPAKLIPVLKSHPKEELLRAQMYVMEEARFISRARGVDRCTYVLDMGKITISSVNTLTLGFLRELIRILQEYYPEIMRRLLIFNTGWAITGAWKVLKPFVDPRVQEKIRFSNGPPSVKSLAEFMTADNVLPGYGGTSKYSVLDEPLQAEVARLRALKAAPVAAPEPAATAPSANNAAPPSPPTEAISLSHEMPRPAPHTPKRESPRSLEAPEELLLEPLEPSGAPSQLYSLYASFAPDAVREVPMGSRDRTSVSGARLSMDYNSTNSFADAADLRSFKSAQSDEDGEDILESDERGMIAQLSDFYGVNDGYLAEGGPAADDTSQSRDSGAMDGLDEVSVESEDEELGVGQRLPHAVHAAAAVPSPHPVPPKAPFHPLGTGGGGGGSSKAGGHVDPEGSWPPAQTAVPSTPPSLPSLSTHSNTSVICVELSLVHSADGTIIGYRGQQRVGEFRAYTIYGNPLCLHRAPLSAPPPPPQQQQEQSAGPGGKKIRYGDTEAQGQDVHAGGGRSGASPAPLGPLSPPSTTPVSRHQVGSPEAGHENSGDRGDDDDSAAHNYIVGELLRESGHPIHSYVIACDAKRKARFVIRKSRLRSRVSVYQVVGDATVATDGKVRHRIAGQKVKMGTAVAPPSTAAARRDPGAWLLYGEDVTRQKKGLVSSLWPFGRVPGGQENAEAAAAAANVDAENVLLAEHAGQTVKFYGILAHSHPVDLFTLAMAISQLWLEGEAPVAGISSGGSVGILGLGLSPRHSASKQSFDGFEDDTDGSGRERDGSPSSHSHSRRLGASGRQSDGGGLAAVGELLREVGNKLSKAIESKSPSTSKPPR